MGLYQNNPVGIITSEQNYVIVFSKGCVFFCIIVKIAFMTFQDWREKMKTDNNIQKFLNKKSFLKLRLNKEILEDGIAYIPCYVQNMEDIICKYSIRDCVSLNSEFTDYITDFIECIPTKYPIVLEIYGAKLTQSLQKETMNLAGQYRRTDITDLFLEKW